MTQDHIWSHRGSTKARILVQVDDRQKYQNTIAYFTYYGAIKNSSRVRTIEVRIDTQSKNTDTPFYFVGETHAYAEKKIIFEQRYAKEEMDFTALPDLQEVLENLLKKINSHAEKHMSDQIIDIKNSNNLKKMAAMAEEKRLEEEILFDEPEDQEVEEDIDVETDMIVSEGEEGEEGEEVTTTVSEQEDDD